MSLRQIILNEAAFGGLPVAAWLLNETNGTSIADLMTVARGTGYTGTANAGVTLANVTGPVNRDGGRYATFNGSSGIVTTSNNSALHPASITLEVWLRPNSGMTGFPVPAHKESGFAPIGGYILFLSGSPALTPNFRVRSSSSANATATSSTALTAGQWSHIVGTHDGTTARIYVNGTQTGTAPASFTNGATNVAFALGNDASGVGTYFGGGIAGACIYNYAMAATRVQARSLASVNGVPRLRGT